MSDPKTNRIDPIQGEIIHVYDGIEEADNELPLWWLLTFYGAIAFSVFYWIIYHELEAAPLPREVYAAALAESASGGEVSEELLVAMQDDPGAVAQGRGEFEQFCVVCHASEGEGNIGPNLTDANWLHGGDPVDIHRTIHEGVLEAGMPAWGASLGSEATVRLTAYVLTIRGTNVDGGKEPQGEIWVPGGTAATEGAADEAPAEDAPADGAPADEAPADEVPADEVPADELGRPPDEAPVPLEGPAGDVAARLDEPLPEER